MARWPAGRGRTTTCAAVIASWREHVPTSWRSRSARAAGWWYVVACFVSREEGWRSMCCTRCEARARRSWGRAEVAQLESATLPRWRSPVRSRSSAPCPRRVAQSGRAPRSHRGGQGFESLPSYQFRGGVIGNTAGSGPAARGSSPCPGATCTYSTGQSTGPRIRGLRGSTPSVRATLGTRRGGVAQPGRAPRSQRGGRRFDSGLLHHVSVAQGRERRLAEPEAAGSTPAGTPAGP